MTELRLREQALNHLKGHNCNKVYFSSHYLTWLQFVIVRTKSIWKGRWIKLKHTESVQITFEKELFQRFFSPFFSAQVFCTVWEGLCG